MNNPNIVFRIRNKEEEKLVNRYFGYNIDRFNNLNKTILIPYLRAAVGWNYDTPEGREYFLRKPNAIIVEASTLNLKDEDIEALQE